MAISVEGEVAHISLDQKQITVADLPCPKKILVLEKQPFVKLIGNGAGYLTVGRGVVFDKRD